MKLLLVQLSLLCATSSPFSLRDILLPARQIADDGPDMKWTEEDSYLYDGWTVESAQANFITVYCEKFKCKEQILNSMSSMADNAKYTSELVKSANCMHDCNVEFSKTETSRRIARLYVEEVYLPKKKEHFKKAGLRI
uniref:Uncharacterized protein n=1 Tax=Trichuris muris TaxID=70415 RepID=A0A5S6Q900_TRIMR